MSGSDSGTCTARLSFKENIVMRFIGLFIFFAPKSGARFLADVTLGVNERLQRGN